jgi:predicted Rossmann fold nucleotide-binding protein DprA/Smf involved in DNA uptake
VLTVPAEMRGVKVVQQPSNANVKALNVLEAAFRAYAREEGRGPFELKTKPVVPYDPSTTLDLIHKTAEALKSAEQRIEELAALREKLIRETQAKMEWAQAAIDSAERRTAEAERLANDVEEKAEKGMAFLMLIQEQLQKAQ